MRFQRGGSGYLHNLGLLSGCAKANKHVNNV